MLAPSSERTDALDALRRAGAVVRPTVLARQQALPVAPALASLLPEGLRRGGTVAVGPGAGTVSLAVALAVEASVAGSWVGAVGVRGLGLAAAAELGLCLERTVVVDPPPASWAEVVAALLDAVDIVWARPPGRARPGDARRLTARARERGAVLVHLGGSRGAWPQPADVWLRVASSVWEGPAGGGAGRLTARRVEVVAGGRGAAARERRAALWLPGHDGRLATATGQGSAGAGLSARWSVAG